MQSLERYPINGTFELTLRCNLRCKMCMLRHADSKNPLLMARELTAKQWEDMAKQAASAGTVNLLLTGGEPMFRRDFIPVYEGIYKQGFLLTLYTNATLVTPQILETLRKMPPHRIGVTLYGASNEEYAQICGCADGFDKAMKGLEKLMTLPSAIEVRMTLIGENCHRAEAIEKLVKEKFGLPVTHTSAVYKSIRGGCMAPESCRMTPNQAVELTYGRILNRLREKLPQELLPHLQLKAQERPCGQGETRYTLLGCGAGMDSYTLTWDGKLLGCQLLDAFNVDALALGFPKAWEAFPATVRMPGQENPHCEKCEFVNSCRICPGVLWAETGSLQGYSPYICEMTKLSEKQKEGLQL